MPVSISPTENFLTLPESDTFSETVTVTVEAPLFDLVEVYFVCDDTTSMATDVAAIRTAVKNLIDTLFARTDATFHIGIGRYTDQIHVVHVTARGYSPTNVTVLKAAIDAQWDAGSGNPDDPEDQAECFIELSDALTAPDGVTDGWWSSDEAPYTYGRPIVVIFGDNPFHDDAAGTLLNDEVLPKLIESGLGTIQVDCGSGSAPRAGLDGQAHSDITGEDCGPGQATAIANATNGALFAFSGSVETDIEDAIDAYLNTTSDLALVASGDTEPFVSDIDPASHSPVTTSPETDYEFDVDFTGSVAAADQNQVFEGTLDVMLQGRVRAQKTVRIIVPRTDGDPTTCIPTEGLTVWLESCTLPGSDADNIEFWDEAGEVESGWSNDFYEMDLPSDYGAQKYSGVANGKAVLRWAQEEDEDPWDYLYVAKHRQLCFAGAAGYEDSFEWANTSKDALSRTGWTIAMLMRWTGEIPEFDSLYFKGFFQNGFDGEMEAGLMANWNDGTDDVPRPFFRYANFYETEIAHYFDQVPAGEWVVLKIRWNGSQLKMVCGAQVETEALAAFPYAIGNPRDVLNEGIQVGAEYLPYTAQAEGGVLCMWKRSLTDEEFDGLDACLTAAYIGGGAGLFSWVFACC